MGDFQFFDIILFAMIAAFLVLRLRSVLGRRTGNERRRELFVRRAPPAGDKAGPKEIATSPGPDKDMVAPALGGKPAEASAPTERSARGLALPRASVEDEVPCGSAKASCSRASAELLRLH